MKASGETHCLAPGCKATSLCKAHIIPAGFARGLSQPGGHNLAVRPDGAKPANQPLGAFDTAILCSGCDQKLGVYDEYAISFCASLPKTGTMDPDASFGVPSFDGETFALAVLAILWRASISKREEWAHISLGPYETVASHILFDGAKLDTFPGFEVFLIRYASSQYDARQFVFNPLRIRSDSLNIFTMGLGGFLVSAKVDRRPLHGGFRPYVINDAKSLAAPYLPFEDSAEYQFMTGAAAEDRKRGRGRES